jgi:hypothetical protein
MSRTVIDSSGQFEQTINSMVAMQQQQQQDGTVQVNAAPKTDGYAKEAMTVTSTKIASTTAGNVSGNNDETNKKSISSNGPSVNMNNTPATYSTSNVSNKNEQKNICTVRTRRFT